MVINRDDSSCTSSESMPITLSCSSVTLTSRSSIAKQGPTTKTDHTPQSFRSEIVRGSKKDMSRPRSSLSEPGGPLSLDFSPYRTGRQTLTNEKENLDPSLSRPSSASSIRKPVVSSVKRPHTSFDIKRNSRHRTPTENRSQRRLDSQMKDASDLYNEQFDVKQAKDPTYWTTNNSWRQQLASKEGNVISSRLVEDLKQSRQILRNRRPQSAPSGRGNRRGIQQLASSNVIFGRSDENFKNNEPGKNTEFNTGEVPVMTNIMQGRYYGRDGGDPSNTHKKYSSEGRKSHRDFIPSDSTLNDRAPRNRKGKVDFVRLNKRTLGMTRRQQTETLLRQLQQQLQVDHQSLPFKEHHEAYYEKTKKLYGTNPWDTESHDSDRISMTNSSASSNIYRPHSAQSNRNDEIPIRYRPTPRHLEIINTLNKHSWDLDYRGLSSQTETRSALDTRASSRLGHHQQQDDLKLSRASITAPISDNGIIIESESKTCSSTYETMPSTAYLRARRQRSTLRQLKPANLRNKSSEPSFDFQNTTNNSRITGVRGFAINAGLKVSMTNVPHQTSRNRRGCPDLVFPAEKNGLHGSA